MKMHLQGPMRYSTPYTTYCAFSPGAEGPKRDITLLVIKVTTDSPPFRPDADDHQGIW